MQEYNHALDEINDHPISRRIPCVYQGKVFPHFPEDDNSCLICAGYIRTNKYMFGCPFTLHDTKKQFTVFRKGIDMNLITAGERFFDIGQRIKINSE